MIISLIFEFCIILWCLTFEFAITLANSQALSCDKSYELMKEAYYDEDWSGCVSHGLYAMDKFKQYVFVLNSCRNKCVKAAKTKADSSSDVFLQFYGASLHQTTCLALCKPEDLKYYSSYLEREPYDFIQICYYKVMRLKLFHLHNNSFKITSV